MKQPGLRMLFLLFLSSLAQASDPPVSGTFSSARSASPDGMFNLIVTATAEGQQFFFQCFTEGEPEFGTLTSVKGRKTEAVLNAGAGCPGSKVRIRLDYEEAWIEIKGKWVAIPRNDIVVPIVD